MEAIAHATAILKLGTPRSRLVGFPRGRKALKRVELHHSLCVSRRTRSRQSHPERQRDGSLRRLRIGSSFLVLPD